MQNNPTTQANRLILRARCERLNKICAKDSLDPFLVVSVESLNNEIVQVYRGLPAGNSFDPVFQEAICIEQPLSSLFSVIFQVYNNDDKKSFVGKYKSMCGELLTNSVVEASLTKNLEIKIKSSAKIIISRQIIPDKLRLIRLQFICQKIDKSLWTAIFKNPQYYFKVYQLTSEKKMTLYESEKIRGQSFCWESFSIHQRTKSTRTLQVQLLNQNKNQQEEVVGHGELMCDSLSGEKEIIIKNHSRKVATFVIEKLEVSELQPFESYLCRGLKIKSMVGIDFTSSNLSYTSPKSLHHIYKGDNIYQKTIQWIYNIFTPYNSCTSIPYYAVGTKVKHPDIYTGNIVQDCFPLNGNKNNHQIADLQQFNLQYKKLLPCLQFSGPFKLQKILMQAKELSESERKKGCFTVLIVINDGTVGDTELAKKRLEQLALYPFFMVALGIKQAEYKELKEIVKVEASRTSLDGKVMRRKLAAFTMVDDKQGMGGVLQAMMCSIAQYMDYQMTTSSVKYSGMAVQQLQKEAVSQTTVES